MSRWAVTVAMLFLGMAFVSADDAPAPAAPKAEQDKLQKPKKASNDDKSKKVDKPPADEKLKRPGDSPPMPKPPDNEEAEILERLSKNTQTAEERLADADAGEKTQKLQDNIVKDIDELIKRLKQPPQDSDSSQSSSSSSSSSSSQQQQQQQQSSAQSRQQRRQRRQQPQQQRGGSARQNTGGNQGRPGERQPTPSEQNAGQGQQPGQQNKNSATGQGTRTNDRNAKGENPFGDLYKDVWGHLPEKMRMEMDSYFKERFMPRYNDLLKQYYSTIAEQNKKK